MIVPELMFLSFRVMWNHCLFRVADLMCLTWHTRFDHYIFSNVMIDTTPEAFAFLWTLVIIMSCLQRQSATADSHPSFPQCRLCLVALRNVCSLPFYDSGRMWLLSR